ncbi:hypothetical protein Tco_0853032 [Tanacetum coccineum]
MDKKKGFKAVVRFVAVYSKAAVCFMFKAVTKKHQGTQESKDVLNESKTADMVCNDAFEVTQELSKRIVELEKDLSKFEAKSISFEIALQHKSRENNSLKTLQKENENFIASLQIENAHLKQTYKDLFDSVQRERVETNECDELRTQFEILKGKRVETKFDNSLILGKPPLLNNERYQLLKQIASLESKLASQDIRSCQKEYHELRTSYNALKVKFDSLSQKNGTSMFQNLQNLKKVFRKRFTRVNPQKRL